MPALYESVTALLAENENSKKLAALMDSTGDQAATAANAAVAVILGGLADIGQSGSSETVSGLMAKNKRSLLNDLPGFLDKPVIEPDSATAGSVFGRNVDRVVGDLASKADLTPPMVDKLLPMLIPIVLAVVAKRRNQDRLDAASVTALLDAERQSLEERGLLEPTGDLVSLGSVKTAGKTAGSGSKQVKDGEAAATGSAERTLPWRAEAAPRAGSDGPKTSGGDSAGSGGSPGSGNSQGSGGSPGSGSSQGADPKPSRRDSGLGEDTPDGERSALGWLSWAVGAVVLVLVLAWLLSTCNSSNDEAGFGNTLVEVDAPDAAQEPAAQQTTVQQTTVVPSPESVEPASPEPEQEVQSSASEEGAAVDPADARTQASVNETLAGSQMTGTFAARVVTLTGTAGSDGEVNDAVAALGIIEGVAVVDDQVEVVAPPAEEDGPQSGATINELLNLEPITFDVRSAQITADGQAVLARAVEFMQSNPSVRIEVGGHTDSDGAADENLDLSRRRAAAVKRYLEEQGVAADRAEARGYGELQPLVPNDSLAAKAENRRIELVIL